MPSIGDIMNFLGISLLGQTRVPEVDLTSKTVIITGGNTGLGFDCAKHLLRLGISHLILACRDTTKGETAKSQLLGEDEYPINTKIEVWQVDLDDYASVTAFCDRVNSQLSRLDGFIANAGLELEKFETSEGCERTLTVNVLSTMYMAYAVLPKLRYTNMTYGVQANLSLVGSLIHVMAPVQELQRAFPSDKGDIFAALSSSDTADMASRYPLSKLLMHLCFLGMIEQTDRQGLQGVTINCVNPGWCSTSLSRAKEMGIVERSCSMIFQRTSEQGSRTLVHGVVAGPETHGEYLSECQIKPMGSFVQSQQGKDASRQVFDDLVTRLENIRAGVTDFKTPLS